MSSDTRRMTLSILPGHIDSQSPSGAISFSRSVTIEVGTPSLCVDPATAIYSSMTQTHLSWTPRKRSDATLTGPPGAYSGQLWYRTRLDQKRVAWTSKCGVRFILRLPSPVRLRPVRNHRLRPGTTGTLTGYPPGSIKTKVTDYRRLLSSGRFNFTGQLVGLVTDQSFISAMCNSVCWNWLRAGR